MLSQGVFIVCTLYAVYAHSIGGNSLPHHVVLDPGNKFHLFWDFDDNEITFEVQVMTLGYVGLGFSPNGDMTGSDMATGWVEDATGKANLQDRFAPGKFEPVVDMMSDYNLLSGSQNGTHTTLRFSRRLILCSNNDFSINNDTARVIWAYSDSEPGPDGHLMYHFQNRGVRSMYLLTYTQDLPPLPADTVTLDLLSPNVLIPATDTTYLCSSFKFPDLTRKHHVIQVEPVIQPGRESEVHHIILHACPYYSNESLEVSHQCRHRNMPPEWWRCEANYFAWAIGGGVFSFPVHVGMPIGDSEKPMMFLMEVHYDNPRLLSGMRDSSGLRLIMTSQLRQYDAGILYMGMNVWDSHVIPPYYKEFLSEGACSSDCLSQGMGNQTDKLNVFAAILHSHLAGHKIRLRHIRDGKELDVLAQDNNYDFNFQETRLLPEERVIQKGDRTLIQCVYNTEDRTDMTYSGLSTREEMCIAFVMYYPKIPLIQCASHPSVHFNLAFRNATADRQWSPNILTPLEYQGRSWKDFFENAIDWSDRKVREDFQKYSLLKNYPVHIAGCIDEYRPSSESFSMEAIPSIQEPLPENSECRVVSATGGHATFSYKLIFLIATLVILMLKPNGI
ncbi:DBH-like monooxygenase protein 1 [Liolophura sinensis]|uniref:DBH-like monooxygenase protein 1 n=1 Tax=Liolophura sinensis TaxID=3198878 RepID=UPI003158C06E